MRFWAPCDCGRLRLGACRRTYYTCIASNRYFMRESTQKGIYICEFISIRLEREMLSLSLASHKAFNLGLPRASLAPNHISLQTPRVNPPQTRARIERKDALKYLCVLITRASQKRKRHARRAPNFRL